MKINSIEEVYPDWGVVNRVCHLRVYYLAEDGKQAGKRRVGVSYEIGRKGRDKKKEAQMWAEALRGGKIDEYVRKVNGEAPEKPQEKPQEHTSHRDDVTLQEWINDCADDKGGSYRAHMKAMQRWVGDDLLQLPLGDIMEDDIDEMYRRILRSGRAPKTIGDYQKALLYCLRRAKRKIKCIVEKPESPRVHQKEMKVLSDDEVKLILKCALRSPEKAMGGCTKEQWRRGVLSARMLLMGLKTALRFIDIKSLTWGDIGEDWIARIVVQKTGRRHKSNLANLQKFLGVRGADNEKVFALPDGFRSVDAVRSAKYAGVNIEGLHFHCTRRTAATRAIEKGAAVHNVQMMLGHTSIAQTEKYLSLGDEGGMEAQAVLDID